MRLDRLRMEQMRPLQLAVVGLSWQGDENMNTHSVMDNPLDFDVGDVGDDYLTQSFDEWEEENSTSYFPEGRCDLSILAGQILSRDQPRSHCQLYEEAAIALRGKPIRTMSLVNRLLSTDDFAGLQALIAERLLGVVLQPSAIEVQLARVARRNVSRQRLMNEGETRHINQVGEFITANLNGFPPVYVKIRVCKEPVKLARWSRVFRCSSELSSSQFATKYINQLLTKVFGRFAKYYTANSMCTKNYKLVLPEVEMQLVDNVFSKCLGQAWVWVELRAVRTSS